MADPWPDAADFGPAALTAKLAQRLATVYKRGEHHTPPE